jgi:hypothetical protein
LGGLSSSNHVALRIANDADHMRGAKGSGELRDSVQ